MENKIVENWQKYSKDAFDAVKELESINTSVIEKLTGRQLALANATVDTGTRAVSAMTEFKDYQEFLAEQTRLASEFNEKLIESARATADIIAESREAYQAWLEKSLKTMTAGAEFAVPGFAFASKASQQAA